MELEQLTAAELAALERAAPRPAARAEGDAHAPLRQLQHGLGNRAFGQLVQAKYADERAGREEAGASAAEVAAAPPASATGGRPLGDAERAFFEPRFGRDFGRVRLHTGAQAAESARSIGARAYAAGQNIVFADGQYAPHTEGGLRLLAHELAHVAQQERPGGGPAAESGAHEVAESVAAGRTVSPQSLGSAAPGLYADNGFSLSPASDASPAYGFRLPPLKVSRKLLQYLIGNGLLTPEMRAMLLRGEIVVEDEEAQPAPGKEGGEAGAGGKNLDLSGPYDELLRRIWRKRTAEEEAAARVAPSAGPSPYAEPKPMTGPLYRPEPKKWLDYKGLLEGVTLNVPLAPNLSLSGLTLNLYREGRFDSKLIAGFDQSLEVKLSYRDWHLSASVDTDGKWLLKLSYPNDSPAPNTAMLDAIFGQGERALREAVRIFKVGPGLDKAGELKDKVSTLATPLKNAADAAKGLSQIQSRVNVSVVLGAGPPPGRLPQSALEGKPQPSTPAGLYGTLNLTFFF